MRETLHCVIWPDYSPSQPAFPILSRGSPEMNSSYWHVIAPKLAASSRSLRIRCPRICFGLKRERAIDYRNIGASHYPKNAFELYKRADERMYRMKKDAMPNT
ncbi:hypothetical protein [Paenibacillus antibioticophila]|uniref:hypothetical protein n=1 Tax=Paenibacillus antibioticophila TaxID=1274374 RepID=UPI001BB36A1D|nr:hypothetical protein [Paenibacillus antibioticophila]